MMKTKFLLRFLTVSACAWTCLGHTAHAVVPPNAAEAAAEARAAEAAAEVKAKDQQLKNVEDEKEQLKNVEREESAHIAQENVSQCKPEAIEEFNQCINKNHCTRSCWPLLEEFNNCITRTQCMSSTQGAGCYSGCKINYGANTCRSPSACSSCVEQYIRKLGICLDVN